VAMLGLLCRSMKLFLLQGGYHARTKFGGRSVRRTQGELDLYQ
jgi:hypothetical protein